MAYHVVDGLSRSLCVVSCSLPSVFLADTQASVLSTEFGQIMTRSAAVSGDTATQSVRWENGSTLRIHFLNGEPLLIERVLRVAKTWSRYANINFEQVAGGDSDIRISFDQSGVSWSLIGRDALRVASNQPTMKFGWFVQGVDDQELSRVVLHEFGHALGLVHEHQSPQGGIQWNEELVYAYFRHRLLPASGTWRDEAEYRDHVRRNVIEAYPSTNSTTFDPDSIMLYDFPAQLTMNNVGTHFNTQLSHTDKAFISKLYPGRPYMQFNMQTRTCLGVTDQTFQFLIATNGDIFAIKKSSTGSGATEVHVLSATSNYQNFSLQTRTCLHETGGSFEFLLASNRDIVAISKSGTGSHSTEIHTLSAASNYQNFSLQTRTCLHETGGNFQFLIAENRDIFAIKKSSTGSGTTEVHVLSATSDYQDFNMHTRTCLHETDHTFEFLIASNRDIIAIKKDATGTHSTEVHTLSAASNYQNFVLQVGTILHETDDTFQFMLTSSQDIVAIKKSGTGSGTTEVHSLKR